MLKEKKTVTFSNIARIYVGYENTLEISDNEGNTLEVKLTDRQLDELQDASQARIKRNLERVREQLAQEQETEE
jgi:hypothetical protein